MAIETKQLHALSKIYKEQVAEDMQKGYVVTAADKKGNTKAWQGYKSGAKKKDGTALYTAADHLKNEEVVHEGDPHRGQGEKIQKRTKAWMDKKGQKGAPGLDAMKARTAEHKSKRGVKEGTDKAFEYVKKQIAAKYGKSGYVSKDNPRKPQTAAEKKKVAAHKAKLAKQDHRDPTEKASDGRYSDRHSNRGSD